MMALEKISKALQDLRLMRVSEKTGIHYNTLKDIRDNPQANPTAKTLMAVTEYLDARQGEGTQGGEQ